MSAIFEVLGSIRKRTKNRLECPNCGEPVHRSRAPLEGWIMPVRYVCDKCGYSGFLAMEGEPVVEEADSKD